MRGRETRRSGKEDEEGGKQLREGWRPKDGPGSGVGGREEHEGAVERRDGLIASVVLV